MNAYIGSVLLQDDGEVATRQADGVVVLEVSDRCILRSRTVDADNRPALFGKVAGGVAPDEAGNASN